MGRKHNSLRSRPLTSLDEGAAATRIDFYRRALTNLEQALSKTKADLSAAEAQLASLREQYASELTRPPVALATDWRSRARSCL